MSQRQYPRQAWVIMPSFRIVEVRITEPYVGWGSGPTSFDVTDKGTTYHHDNLFDSHTAAVKFAGAKLDKKQAAITKQQNNLDKWRTNFIAETNKTQPEKSK